MLTVTDAAGAHLAQLLDDHGLAEDVAVRFVVEEQGIAMRQDNQRPGDATFEHEGRTVLVMDSQVSELLTEDTLDIEDAKLTLKRPGQSQ
jgi:Fe-S cluster assembly iron-binding protein IscA